jgi:hypothetical protein
MSLAMRLVGGTEFPFWASFFPIWCHIVPTHSFWMLLLGPCVCDLKAVSPDWMKGIFFMSMPLGVMKWVNPWTPSQPPQIFIPYLITVKQCRGVVPAWVQIQLLSPSSRTLGKYHYSLMCYFLICEVRSLALSYWEAVMVCIWNVSKTSCVEGLVPRWCYYRKMGSTGKK